MEKLTVNSAVFMIIVCPFISSADLKKGLKAILYRIGIVILIDFSCRVYKNVRRCCSFFILYTLHITYRVRTLPEVFKPGKVWAIKKGDEMTGKWRESVGKKGHDARVPYIFDKVYAVATIENTVIYLLVQIEYDGVKEYKSHSGIDTKFIFPKAAPKIVATDERMLFVDGLVPRTVYSFNISAYFTDDTWGPVHQIRVETSIGGGLLSFHLLSFFCLF